MSGQPAVLQVVILRDGLLVGTEVFVPGSYVLGSGTDADLHLDDNAVAREHAFLYFQNGKAAVQDAGSPAGLYVNGHRVNACEIRPVDEVVVGPFVLKVRILAQRPDGRRMTPQQPNRAQTGGQPVARQSAAPPIPAVPAVPPVGRNKPQPAAQVSATAPTQPPTRSRPAGPPASPPPAAARATRPAGNAAPAQAVANRAAAAQPQQQPEGTVPSARRRGALSVVPASATNMALAALDVPGEDAEEVTVAANAADIQALLKRSNEKGPELFSLPRKGGAARLYFELYWGKDRQVAASFKKTKKKGVVARGDGSGDLPLYGFRIPDEGFTLAQSQGKSYRVFIPGGARVAKRNGDGAFGAISSKELESEGSDRFVTLSLGQAVKITEGNMSLFAYVAPKPKQVFVNPLAGLPWLAIFFYLIFGGGLGGFIFFGPQPEDAPDFTAQNLPPVAVRLMLPERKKPPEKPPEKPKEEVKKEEPKKEEPKRKPEKIVKRAPKPPPIPTPAPPPETAALKALKKIAAGPGTKDILAAMSKLGSGPGAKSNAFKLSGLLGKAPVAINGIGLGGLGGQGGGYGTKGAELLRGRGSGGIGALGVGSVGKGDVRGVVHEAVAHSVSAQGTIDRDLVAKVINSHFQEVRACYERALIKEAGIAGKVTLEWTISTNGKVVAAKTKSSSLRNGAVETCILSNLKTWQFPPAKGGLVIITYPFIFESKGF